MSVLTRATQHNIPEDSILKRDIVCMEFMFVLKCLAAWIHVGILM
jgi:hypothetical protein